MKKIIFSCLVFVLLSGQNVFAHGDHGHSHGPITEAQALLLADEVASQLTVREVGLDIGKLSVSWATIPKEDIAVYKKGKGYYIVAVENKAEEKALYVLMSSEGAVYDANFSGKFHGIE